MKQKILFILFPALLICLFYSCGNKEGKDCNSEHCASKAILSDKSGIVVSDTSKDLSCKLTTAELQKRREEVLSVLKSGILEKKELKDGYSFKFENSDKNIDMLTDFVKSERQCCDFFNFSIQIKNNGELWFDLTGPKDAKEIIGAELGL